MNALTASTVAGHYRDALALIARGESLMYVNLTEWTEARRQGVSLSALRKATGVSRDYANALIHLGALVESSAFTGAEDDALPARGWDALRQDVDAIVRDDVSVLDAILADMDGTEDLPTLDAILAEAGDRARASRKRKDRQRQETGEETGEGDRVDLAETPPTRGNAALIADAMSALARVDALTMTDEEAAALASLSKQATATGRAWQAAQAASKAA